MSSIAESQLSELAAQVRRLQAEADLRQLLQRYAAGTMEGDRELVLSCFVEDLHLDYGFTVIEGRTALREFLTGAKRPELPVQGLSAAITRTQLISTTVVSLHETTAELVSTGLSAHGGVRDGEKYVVVRSLRYHDRCVLEDGVWLISHRRYTPQWAFEAPASVVVALPPGQA
jgi:hypothetical protein